MLVHSRLGLVKSGEDVLTCWVMGLLKTAAVGLAHMIMTDGFPAEE